VKNDGVDCGKIIFAGALSERNKSYLGRVKGGYILKKGQNRLSVVAEMLPFRVNPAALELTHLATG